MSTKSKIHNKCGTPECCGECDTAVKSVKEAIDSAPPYDIPSDNITRINYWFDEIFENKFTNPYLIINAVSAILQKFTINMPVVDPSGGDEVFIFSIGSTLYLYLCIERDGNGHYDAFAQIVDPYGLGELQDAEIYHEGKPTSGTEYEYPSHFIKQARHSADD